MTDSTARASVFVGREDTLELLRAAVAATATGTGAALLVQGPAGIGKSALLAEVFAGRNLDCRVCWELTGERLVRRWCAGGPVVLVADDLQRADAESLARWRGLIRLTGELPLTLIGACRTLPVRPELERIRLDLAAHGDPVLTLEPLPDPAAHALAEHLMGAPPGRGLRELAVLAAGNPSYLGELAGQRPAVADHLAALSAATQEALRWAALLGREFTAAEVAAVADRSGAELDEAVAEALLAGFLVATGERLAFRHPLVEATLRQRIPASTRDVLHRQIAEVLAWGAGEVSPRQPEGG